MARDYRHNYLGLAYRHAYFSVSFLSWSWRIAPGLALNVPNAEPAPARLPYLALPCPALPCPALPCPALPCSALLCPALPFHACLRPGPDWTGLHGLAHARSHSRIPTYLPTDLGAVTTTTTTTTSYCLLMIHPLLATYIPNWHFLYHKDVYLIHMGVLSRPRNYLYGTVTLPMFSARREGLLTLPGTVASLLLI